MSFPIVDTLNAFERFVEGVIADRYRTASALAEAVGMSLSAFQRGVKAGSLGVDKCLVLAERAGVHPSEVLRLAGKGETAAIIERLYAKDQPHLSPIDLELIALPMGAKRQMLRLVHEVNDDHAHELVGKRKHA